MIRVAVGRHDDVNIRQGHVEAAHLRFDMGKQGRKTRIDEDFLCAVYEIGIAIMRVGLPNERIQAFEYFHFQDLPD